MRKSTKDWMKVIKQQHAHRAIGPHSGCSLDGTVFYHSTGTMGVRYCGACGQSSANGSAPDTVAEMAARAAANNEVPRG